MSATKTITFLVCFTVLFSACKKNKLKGEYASFIGSYSWERTGIITGPALSTKSATLYKTDVNYTVKFELNDKGEAIFYKNGSQVSKNKYTIQDKESNSYGGKELIIKLKGKLNGLNIDEDKLKINLSGDTSLTLDKFPFPAIEEVSVYRPGYRSLDNTFRND